MNISNGDGVYAWLHGQPESRPNLVALGWALGEIVSHNAYLIFVKFCKKLLIEFCSVAKWSAWDTIQVSYFVIAFKSITVSVEIRNYSRISQAVIVTASVFRSFRVLFQAYI